MSEIRVDTISEKTSANGVAVDGVTLKDGQVDLADNKKILIGDSDDLEIYHDGSNSVIKDAGTGNLQIQADDFKIMNVAGDENILFAAEDGTVRLFHNNVTKIETTSAGIDVTGTVTSDGASLDGAVVINEAGANADFRVESDDRTHMFHIDAANNNARFDSTNTDVSQEVYGLTPLVQVRGNHPNNASLLISEHVDDANGPSLFFYKSRNTAPGSFSRVANNDALGAIHFIADDGSDAGSKAALIVCEIDGTPGSNDTPGRLSFYTTADGAADSTERMRIHNGGNITIGRTAADLTVAGISLEAAGTGGFVRDNGPCIIANRLSNDGEIIRIVQAGTTEGTISTSGSTVSYNAFTGSHWSRLVDNSKPTILRGTIMESLDSMMNWYQAVADVAEVKYIAEDKDVQKGLASIDGVKTEAHTIKKDIALPNGKSVGDAVTFTHYGTEYTGVYAKESDVKHVHSKVSTTADSNRVYGVFHCWGNDNVADVNDMEIAQVGTYIIRVHKDVTVAAGDLLVSNGDGTAKKQDDDIIRSKTVAKVNSNIKVGTYSDGSYTVPCTLHC